MLGAGYSDVSGANIPGQVRPEPSTASASASQPSTMIIRSSVRTTPARGILMTMADDFSPTAVVATLEHGRSVLIPSSKRHSILVLVLAFVIGIGLLAFFVFIVTATLQDGRTWWLIVANLRIWALVVGIVGCLVVAPIAVVVRMRRRESLVLSPAGVALARHGEVLPGTLLPWHDIVEVVFEQAVRRGPKALAYILTEDATRRRRGRNLNPRLLVKGGFVLSHRRLYPVLAAAHARFAPRIHGRR